MFIRQFIRRNKDGSARVYLYLCRNYVSGGKERQELVANLGRMDVLQAGGALDRLIGSLARYSERCWVEVEGEGSLSRGQVYGTSLGPTAWRRSATSFARGVTRPFSSPMVKA